MDYSGFRKSFLIVSVVLAYLLFSVAVLPNLREILARIAEIVILTFLLLAALVVEVPVPGYRLKLYLVYPFAVLAILILKAVAVVPCFLAGFAWGVEHCISVRTKKKTKTDFFFYLWVAYEHTRLIPAVLLASFVYANSFSFILLSVAFAGFDLLNVNAYAALADGKAPWRIALPPIALAEIPFIPLSLPIYYLYRWAGATALLWVCLPIIAVMWSVRHLLQIITRQQELLEELNMANELMRTEIDLKQMVQKVLNKVRSAVKSDAVEVFLKSSDTWHLAGTLGASPWERGAYSGALIELLCARFRAEPTLFRDIRGDPRFSEYEKGEFHSLLTIPLHTGRDLMGFLVCAKRIPYYFFEDHLRISRIIMGQISSLLLAAVKHEDLVVALLDLQKANRLKRQFLASVSHELRTPLSAIISHTFLLLERMGDSLSPPDMQSLQAIQESSDRLLGMVNDLLDMSKIEAGKMKMAPIPLALEPFLRRQADSLAPLAVAKRLVLECDCPPGFPLVYADPQRLSQIITNLVGNAIKFTDEGKITVTADVRDSFAEIRVMDPGIGIPEDELPNIFEEFYQLEGMTSKGKRGTGLGLAIAKRLVEMQNGSISAESTVGKGSTFRFTMPLAGDSSEPG